MISNEIAGMDSFSDLEEKTPFYIEARKTRGDDHPRVLKHEETFAVFDHFGDIKPEGFGEEGLFHRDTRYLSHSSSDSAEDGRFS